MRAQVKALHQELQQLRAHHKALLQSDSRARMDDAEERARLRQSFQEQLELLGKLSSQHVGAQQQIATLQGANSALRKKVRQLKEEISLDYTLFHVAPTPEKGEAASPTAPLFGRKTKTTPSSGRARVRHAGLVAALQGENRQLSVSIPVLLSPPGPFYPLSSFVFCFAISPFVMWSLFRLCFEGVDAWGL